MTEARFVRAPSKPRSGAVGHLSPMQLPLPRSLAHHMKTLAPGPAVDIQRMTMRLAAEADATLFVQQICVLALNSSC